MNFQQQQALAQAQAMQRGAGGMPQQMGGAYGGNIRNEFCYRWGIFS
jgi:hypothetical protein